MDVNCLRCNEPWDVYHLRHDVIYEAIFDGGLWPEIRDLEAKALQAAVQERWKAGSVLTPEVRQAFAQIGWEFGSSVLIVKECSCCKDHHKLDSDAYLKAQVIAECLGDDLDGQASMMEEMM